MEAKINVAEILKDKPENTKLYSPLFGDVYFSYIENSIIKVKHHGGMTKFFDNSRYYNYPESEPLLFPSKEMRDWSKFAWKRGDVLVSDDGCIEVIFDKWYDDTYTSFYGKHYLDSENENDIVYIEAFICTTERFSLEDKESFLCYINTIEERLGGKLNRETLEIEKKAVVDLKPKCEFKPFDRCIWKIRNCEGSIWQASFVSYVDEYGATPMGMSIDEDLVNLIILPYNDQTKLLVGTTYEWKGGEG